MACKSSGTPTATSRRNGGAVLTMASSTWLIDSPANGALPVSTLNIRLPNENTSDAGLKRLALRLLGRSVKRRAFEPAPLPAGFLQRKRETEVQNPRPQVRADDHVVRLEIAMNESARVRHRKSARHFAQQPRLLLEVELRRKAVERIALDEFHHDRRRIGFVEHRENRHDGGIAERGGVACLVEHAAAHLFIGVAAQDFDDHAAVELLVVRGIDHAQTALAQLAFDAEARQARQLLLGFGRRTPLLAAQLAHVQSGLDALAGFPAHGFGQLRDEILDLPGVRLAEAAQEHIGVDGGVHDGRAWRGGGGGLQPDRRPGRRIQETHPRHRGRGAGTQLHGARRYRHRTVRRAAGRARRRAAVQSPRRRRLQRWGEICPSRVEPGPHRSTQGRLRPDEKVHQKSRTRRDPIRPDFSLYASEGPKSARQVKRRKYHENNHQNRGRTALARPC